MLDTGLELSQTQPRPNDPYDSRIGNGALPAGFQGSQNRAYTRDVQGNELMGQRLGALIAGNSAYMRNAVNRGREQAASRGMLNSSMAAGSAQRAAIEAASPIAAQEAQAYIQGASENQRWLNERASEIDRRMAAEASARGAGAQAGAMAATALQSQRERLAFEGEQRGLDRTQALFMADRQLENQLELGEAEYGWNLGRDAFGFENEDYRAGRDFGFRDYEANRDFGFEDYAAGRDFGFQTERDYLLNQFDVEGDYRGADIQTERDRLLNRFQEESDYRQFGNEDYRANRDFGFDDYAANRDNRFQTDRDYRQFNFQGRLSRQEYQQNRTLQRDRFEQGIQDYAARTGIDLSTQSAQYLAGLAQAALEDPEMFPPEVVAAMQSTFEPLFGEQANAFLAGLPDLFNNFNRGSGNQRGGNRRRTNTRRGR